TVPNTIALLTRLLKLKQLDFSNAQLFFGTKDELREKLITILQSLNVKKNVENLADGITLVFVNGEAMNEACKIYRVKSLSRFIRCIKVCFDF
ncbi:hypothetical protein PENTCL1PPCAC_23590, partial [Pristionchus entomophagus]